MMPLPPKRRIRPRERCERKRAAGFLPRPLRSLDPLRLRVVEFFFFGHRRAAVLALGIFIAVDELDDRQLRAV